MAWDAVFPLELTPPTALGQWHEFRGNGQHTGYAEQIGDITDPQILWSHFLGSRESWAALTLSSSGAASVPLPAANINISQSELASWGVGGEWYDLNGTGTLLNFGTGFTSKVGDFLPAEQGLELLQVVPVPGSTTSEARVTLSRRVAGGWQQTWQSAVLPLMAGPNIIAGDFNNDGQLQVAVTGWDRLYLLNMATGVVQQSAVFKHPAAESGRPYGYLGAHDVDGDGRNEFVLLGDFQEFIAVMGWDSSGALVKLWDHLIEVPITGKSTVHRPGIEPVMDVTGDGRMEVVTSIFNDNGDGRWHVMVYDAVTGNILLDLPDYFLDGMRNVDGAPGAELFVTRTSGATIPTSGPIQILKYTELGATVLWELGHASFHSQPLSKLPINVNSSAATGRLALLAAPVEAGEQDVFFTKRILDAAAGTTEVIAWRSNGLGTIAPIASVIGPDAAPLAVRVPVGNQPQILVRAEVFNETLLGSLTRTGATSSFVYSAVQGPPRSSAVVGRLQGGDDRPTVVIQGGGERIVALQPHPNGEVDVTWRTTGRGISTGGDSQTGQHQFSGVALADLFGNGELATLVADKSDGGNAVLRAVAADGAEIWRTEFPVSGATPVFNQGALTFWQRGRFNSAERDDVLVTVRRGSLHSDVFYMLDGRTGEVLWTRDWGDSAQTRGAGGSILGVFDWNQDGLEEAVNFFPDRYYVVDGAGQNLVDRSFAYDVFGSQIWPFYGNPVVADFLNNGTKSVLYAGGYQIMGLLDLQGNAMWQTPFQTEGYPGFVQGIGDIDGDGDLDILSPGHQVLVGNQSQSEFRAYDGATGALLWKLPLPGMPFGPIGFPYLESPTLSVSADIDGDGRVESIFAIGPTLFVVGSTPDGNAGMIKWAMDFEGLVGSPIIADANGDGRLEIIVVTTDGFVYGIGQLPPLPGDFDGNLLVDGNDFLIWQRGPKVGRLSDWQMNFGLDLNDAPASSAAMFPSDIDVDAETPAAVALTHQDRSSLHGLDSLQWLGPLAEALYRRDVVARDVIADRERIFSMSGAMVPRSTCEQRPSWAARQSVSVFSAVSTIDDRVPAHIRDQYFARALEVESSPTESVEMNDRLAQETLSRRQ
ncbi:MAG TPA: PQQ-binding-like beta-propeller repeat protein [Lacipirellulaceae bacterium]|nr:PQQ-binding-like beta-propeller repeat protein [Lacipirellulaceae bacterium]